MNDLVKMLRESYVSHGLNYVQAAADRIEADEALLRQALEALVLAARHDMWPDEEAQQDAAIAAVRKRLEAC